jgi:uncharacterized protein
MNPVFADTHYWVAILDPHDSWHLLARAAKKELGVVSLVTTDEVLVEVLNTFGGRGEHLRRFACAFVYRLRRESAVRIIPQSRTSFDGGLVLYSARHDKGYSLVDCISMTTMRRLGIEDVLTNDSHFAQEGFNILIR